MLKLTPFTMVLVLVGTTSPLDTGLFAFTGDDATPVFLKNKEMFNAFT